MLEKEKLESRGGNKGNIREHWKQEHIWSYTEDREMGLHKGTTWTITFMQVFCVRIQRDRKRTTCGRKDVREQGKPP